MKEKIQPIINDLMQLMKANEKQENYEVCKDIKQYIDDFQKFMNDELEWTDISPDVLDICLLRYELLKTAIISRHRYALFSAFGNWFVFWLGTTAYKSEVWDDIKIVEKNQEKRMMAEIETFHRLPIARERE